MAQGEFWLPSEFLTDDELLMDFKTTKGYAFGNLSSPVESLMSSTETESDEDEYINGLTHMFTRSTVNDPSFTYDNAKWQKLSGSPQSTLGGSQQGCGCISGSSRVSPNCVSGYSSPTESSDLPNFDMLYAAAGEVAKMKITEEMAAIRKLMDLQRKSNRNQSSGFYPNHNYLAYQQLQAKQFLQMKQQQIMKQQYENRVRNLRRNEPEKSPGLSMSAWPALQKHQSGSNTRPVFLGETGVKKERTGTGVFIPRRTGPQHPTTETRKKTAGYSTTVLIPDRVVQALNMNQTSHIGPKLNDSAALKYNRNTAVMSQQKSNNLRMNQELRLPQEWTY